MDARSSSARPEVLLAHADWARALARALVGDAERADDALQDAWVAALERPPAAVGRPRQWLGGVLRNVVRQRRRAEGRRTEREQHAREPRPAPTPPEVVERAELHRRVVELVLALEEPARTTLLLRYFDDLSAEEVARRLGEPASTVRSRLHTTLESLRARLDRETEGGRTAWSVALLGLASPPTPIPAAAGATAAASAASVPGASIMIQSALAATLVVGAGLTATLLNPFAPRAEVREAGVPALAAVDATPARPHPPRRRTARARPWPTTASTRATSPAACSTPPASPSRARASSSAASRAPSSGPRPGCA